MFLIVNGERQEVPDRSTVADVVSRLGRDPAGRGVAVAVAGEVIPRAAWASTELRQDAQLEVVTAVQGG